MPSADLPRIIVHVTALLNANTRSIAGVSNYTNAVGDNARSSAEIAETCLLAALKTAQAVCESDSHPFRVAFLADTTLVHGDPIPFHYGDTAIPTITPFSGAAFTLKGVRKAFNRIESYRINKNTAYSKTNHNLATSGGGASILAGFYDIVEGIGYYTGFSATMKLATFDRTNAVARLPDGIEPTIIKLALGMSGKEGDSSDNLFAGWSAQGMSDLAEIKNGATIFSPVDDQIAARGDQVA